MKTMAVAAWKWILVGVLVAIIGVLLVVGGRKRGTRLYRLRMSLWTTVLALLGGGMLLVGCPADKNDDTATCYKDVGIQDVSDAVPVDQPDAQMLCYAPDMSRPDEPRSTCYMDIQISDTGDSDGVLMCYWPEPDVKEAGPTCYAIDVVTPPGEDIQPTCYKPLPPDAVTDAVDAGQPDVPGPTCYAPPFPEDVSDQEAQEEVVPQPDVPGPTCYMPPPPERR